jgi:eukaryotic-like serine/threonine-protein kinase
LWAQNYPQDPAPLDALGNDALVTGQYPQAVDFLLQEKKLSGGGYYTTALGGRKTRRWSCGARLSGRHGAYWGRSKEAWGVSARAVAAAERENENENATKYLARAALRAAEFGDSALAVEHADAALKLYGSSDVKVLSAVALTRAGVATRAQPLAHQLVQDKPSHTMLSFYWLPTVRAASALELKHAAEAIDLLQVTAPYELGQPLQMGPATLYPVYVRGEAYLRLHQGDRAAAEFQKLLDHPGCVMNFPLGALAHLQLGRAHALAGDTAKAKKAYQDFLTLWKDADPDIPILKQAKAEYAKLK